MSRKQRREPKKTKRNFRDYSQPPEQAANHRAVEPLVARSQVQADYISSIRDNTQTFAIGPAGSGKTFVSAAIAADMLIARDITKIVLCRPAVEAEEWHGYLPGSIIDKMAPWIKPFTDVIESRVGKTEFKRMLNDGVIEIVPFAFMRGLTFSDAFVILDEAQNATPRQMKLFLTRIGDNVKVVINGDLTQKDIPGESGLEVALNIACNRALTDTGVVRFTKVDIVRSAVCQAWVDAYEGTEQK